MARRNALGLLFMVTAVLAILTGLLEFGLRRGILAGTPPLRFWADMWQPFVGAAAACLVMWVVFRLLGRAHQRQSGKERSIGLRTFETIAAVALTVFLVIALMDGVSTAVVSLGLVGFGLTLALQRPILSMAGWGAVRFGRLFREGDRIEIDGIVGDVLEITLMKTRIWEIGSHWSPLPWGGTVSPLRQTGRIVTISNATFLEKPLANATADFGYVFDEFVATVAYEADWRFAEQLLKEVAERVIDVRTHDAAASQYEKLTRHVGFIGDFPHRPVVIMVLQPSWIEYRLRYLVEVRKRSLVGTELARQWQIASSEHPNRIPQVYPRSQPMAVAGDGRPMASRPGVEPPQPPAASLPTRGTPTAHEQRQDKE